MPYKFLPGVIDDTVPDRRTLIFGGFSPDAETDAEEKTESTQKAEAENNNIEGEPSR